MELVYVEAHQLSPNQKLRIKELQRECFRSVSADEIRECFIAESFGWVFAYTHASIVGQLELYLRQVFFAGRRISLGGLGGTCVTASNRNKGIGSELVKRGLEILKEKGADIACLSADVKNYPYGIYHKLGFELMEREISFEDVYGRTRHDFGELFIPVCSMEVYDL
jgi:predicted N-acetyltransferase YhbS